MKLFFVLYAGLIPMVPLIGVEIFRKRSDKRKLKICAALFFMQLCISILSVIAYL